MSVDDQVVRLNDQIVKLNDRIAKLERQVQFLLGQSSVPYVDMPPAAGSMPYADVAALKRQGKLLDAIKLYRSYTGATLEAAKNFVENMLY